MSKPERLSKEPIVTDLRARIDQRARKVGPTPEPKPQCYVCNDGGWALVDPARSGPGAPVRVCDCKVGECEAHRLRYAAANLPPNLATVHWDRNPVMTFSPPTKRALRKYVRHWQEYRERGDGLWLGGEIGVGKTFAAAMVFKAIAEENEAVRKTRSRRDHHGNRVLGFWSCDRLLRALRASHNEASDIDPSALHAQLAQLELLVIDDLKAPRYTDWARSELYGLINYRVDNQLPTIVTCDVSYDELRTSLEPRTIDRLRGHCKVIEIKRVAPSAEGYRHYVDPIPDEEDEDDVEPDTPPVVTRETYGLAPEERPTEDELG